MIGLLLGIGGGLVIGGMIQRRRAFRHNRGPWGLWRALDLDGDQRDELRGLFFNLKKSARELRRRDDWMRLVEVLAQPSFDRAKVEEVSSTKAAAFERLRGDVVSALERAHSILKPEQRERLAEWFNVGLHPASSGPYR